MEFRNKMQIATLGVFATIFTWGFIQAFRKTLVTPLIRAYLIPARNEEDMSVLLRGDQRLDFGEFVAELIQWLVLMALLFFIWKISHTSEWPW